jgi:hypothetical protein
MDNLVEYNLQILDESLNKSTNEVTGNHQNGEFGNLSEIDIPVYINPENGKIIEMGGNTPQGEPMKDYVPIHFLTFKHLMGNIVFAVGSLEESVEKSLSSRAISVLEETEKDFNKLENS